MAENIFCSFPNHSTFQIEWESNKSLMEKLSGAFKLIQALENFKICEMDFQNKKYKRTNFEY